MALMNLTASNVYVHLVINYASVLHLVYKGLGFESPLFAKA